MWHFFNTGQKIQIKLGHLGFLYLPILSFPANSDLIPTQMDIFSKNCEIEMWIIHHCNIWLLLHFRVEKVKLDFLDSLVLLWVKTFILYKYALMCWIYKWVFFCLQGEMGKSGERGPEGEPGIKVPMWLHFSCCS